MKVENLFLKLNTCYQKGKPFVAYRKPDENKLFALIQLNEDLNYLNNYSQSGFVFAPFQHENNAIFFPLKKCEFLQSDSLIADEDLLDSELKHQMEMKANSAKEKHLEIVQNAIEEIEQGGFFKVVISRKESIEIEKVNIEALLRKLLKHYPNAFVYIWFHPEVGLWLGATPETLLEIKGKEFKTMALAGTQTYKRNVKVDWPEKEKLEQKYVTDFMSDNLKDYNINIGESFSKKSGNLMHICTEIHGNIKSEKEIENIIDKIHPTPATCGYPKNKSRDFILKNEGYDREYYTGFLGELNIKKATKLYVNLRCMQIRNKKTILYIGGGITKGSVPEKEWEETVVKSNTMKRIL